MNFLQDQIIPHKNRLTDRSENMLETTGDKKPEERDKQ
jgi:hypothetical protein